MMETASGVASVCLSRKSGNRMGSVLRFRCEAIAAERAKHVQRLALAAELVGEGIVVGKAKREAANDELVVRDVQVPSNDVVVVPPGGLRAGVEAASTRRQHQGLQEDAAIEKTSCLQLAVHRQ